jgi:hypothetical protein
VKRNDDERGHASAGIRINGGRSCMVSALLGLSVLGAVVGGLWAAVAVLEQIERMRWLIIKYNLRYAYDELYSGSAVTLPVNRLRKTEAKTIHNPAWEHDTIVRSCVKIAAV